MCMAPLPILYLEKEKRGCSVEGFARSGVSDMYLCRKGLQKKGGFFVSE